MKPSWKDAPEWAQYLAQERNGRWWWFEEEPDYLDYSGTWAVKDFGLTRSRIALEVEDNSADSLEHHPNET